MKLNIHNVAEFLILNIEVVEEEYIDLRMPLLHFFFFYGNKYKKKSFTDFAFELLEEYLLMVLEKIDNIEDTNISDLEIGCSLMEFISMNFFESDDIDEILEIFDKVAIIKMENFIKVHFAYKNGDDLLLLIMYFMNRCKTIDKKSQNYLSIKEHLSISFLELVNYTNQLKKTKTSDAFLMKLFFEEYENYFKNNHPAIEGIKNNNKIAIEYRESNGFDLEMALLQYMCRSKNIRTQENDNDELAETLMHEMRININDLYNENIIITKYILEKTVIFSNVLLQISSFENSIFLAFKTKALIA